MHPLTGICVSLLLLISAAASFAATATETFRDGIQAYRNGRFALAAQYFEQARFSGMDTVSLYYNLGVCYYRMADYEQAEQAFRRAAAFPAMAPLAYYNLGLVKLKQGNDSEADDRFRQALAASEDDKLTELASFQLSRLQRDKPGPSKPEAAPSNWLSFINISVGYDDNVTLDNDTLTAVSAQDDSFLELMASTRGVISGKRYDGIVLRASLFADRYNSLTEFDLSDFNLGLYKTFTLSDWKNEAGAFFTYSTLGDGGYLKSANLEWDIRRRVTDRISLRVRVRYSDIAAVEPQYDYIDGTRAFLRLEGSYKTGSNGKLRARYQLENNDRNGYATATTFSSLSPLRHTVLADYSRYIGEHWYFKLGGEYRTSSYSEANVEVSGDVINRDDERARYLLMIERMLGAGTNLSFEYSYTDNQSNIERYTYQRNMVMAGIFWIFQ